MTTIIPFRRRRRGNPRSPWGAGKGFPPRKAPRRRHRSWLLFEWIFVIGLFAALSFTTARYDKIATRTVAGHLDVSDGDSVRYGSKRIRLRGIDAPELTQMCVRQGQAYPCGREAKAALQTLVQSGPITCEWSEIDKYGRLLAQCAAGTVDINRTMVRQGWAVAYGDYEVQEAAAQADKIGLWAGTFEQPRAWRDTHGGIAEPEQHDWLLTLANWVAQLAGWRVVPEDAT